MGADQTGVVYQNAYNIFLGTCGQLDVKVFLQGPYNTSSGLMYTTINATGDLPLVHPYGGAPWNYTGTESVAVMPADVVDWILIELRDAPDAASATSDTRAARQAALLLNNGTIVGVDGSSSLEFNNSTLQQLFIVLWHRNHLGIISAIDLVPAPVDVYTYNFTTAASQAYGNGQNHLGNGIYGMIGGDANADGTINLTDVIQIWTPQAGSAGYLKGDMNLDRQVNNQDKNELWFENLYDESQVPD